VVKAYDRYEFHVVYQRVSQFVAVELSAIYHDVIKDRLYTDPANSLRRRSTQTALHRLVTGLCRVLAPVLAFTADEAWEFLPQNAGVSAHESLWRPAPFALTTEEQATWQSLFALREPALTELEKARQSKLIGKALEAKLRITTRDAAMLMPHRESLRELLNVSALEIEASVDAAAPTFGVSKADGQKCERCWHWEKEVGSNAEHPTICNRCVEAVKQLK
jgi:isoleucyl-tRNA synthetase